MGTGWRSFVDGIALALGGLAVCVCSAAAQPDAVEASRQYSAAVRLQNLGSYDIAADAWRKFVDQYPRDPRVDKATHYLGVCYFHDGKLEQALAAFQKVVKSFPKSVLLDATYLYLGATQYQLGQSGKPEYYGQGAQTLATLLEKFPQSRYVPDGLFYRGECLYMQKKRKEAAAMYRQLVEKYPKHTLRPDALWALGVAQDELGQKEAAEATFRAFLAEYPQHELATEVSMRLGEVLFASGRHDEALDRFTRAAGTAGFAMADWAAIRQADTLVKLGRYAQAAKVYASLPQRFPQSKHLEEAALAAGKAYYRLGQIDEAIAQLRRVYDAGGEQVVEAAHWLAKAWLKQGRPADALGVVEKALAEDKDSRWRAELLMDRADAVYQLPKRRAESVGLYAELARKYPRSAVAPQALYMAAFAALESGQGAVALEHARSFFKAYADSELAADVTHVAAESLLVLKRYAEAAAEYGELIKRYPRRDELPVWQLRRALALHLDGKHEAAIDLLQPVLKRLDKPELVAEAHYVIGASRLALDQYQQAARSLEASLAATPRWPQAAEVLLLLALAQRRQDQTDAAVRTLERLIRDYPSSPDLDKAHYRLGECRYLQGNYEAAAEAYRKLVEDWPKSPLAPHALHEWGCAELDRGDVPTAEKVLSQLVADFPNHALVPRARYARALARYRLKDYRGAIDDLQAMLAADPQAPEKADAQYLLGMCQMSLESYQEAVAAFESLLENEPNYKAADSVQYQLGWALQYQGRQAEAAQVFARLAKDYPQSPRAAEAWFHVGQHAYGRKDYTEAAKAYYLSMQKAGVGELGEKATYKLGWSYYHQELFDAARKTFTYQRKTYPRGPLAADAAFMEAECLFRLGNYQQALDAYEQLEGLTTDEFRAQALLHAGQAAGRVQKWQKSAELLTRCTTQFPDSPYADEAWYELGWAWYKLGKADQAVEAFQKAIDKGGASGTEAAARAQFMIGEIQFERKDHAEAIKSFFKVIYGYGQATWQAEATYEAARCFEVLKRPGQAVELYRELIQKYPKSSKAPLARQRLDQLQAKKNEP